MFFIEHYILNSGKHILRDIAMVETSINKAMGCLHRRNKYYFTSKAGVKLEDALIFWLKIKKY